MAAEDSKMVRKQYPPFYRVDSYGVTIEFTDDYKTAERAYREAGARSKSMAKIASNGATKCLFRSPL